MIKTSDLLGVPWHVCNCGQAVREGLTRMGLAQAAESVPVDQASAAALVRSGGGQWEILGSSACNAQVGDVILSDGPEGDLHVSLVIGPNQALTSARRVGVFVPRVSSLSGVRGVYRWREPR